MYGILFDATQCVGCGACMDACKEKNRLPESEVTKLSATNYTVVEERDDDLYLRRMCMHCLSPSCVSACPVGALQKTKDGPVIYEFDRCIGCRYCMVACPFGVPRYEWGSMTPRVSKCQLCPDRVSKGQPTACAEACPTEATTFGKRDDLLAIARKRIANHPERYAQKIYGAEEAGGTSVLIIGPQEIMDAFDKRIPQEALPEKTWVVLSQIPTSVSVAGAGLLAVNWVIRRRMAMAARRVDHGADDGAAASPARRDEGGEV